MRDALLWLDSAGDVAWDLRHAALDRASYALAGALAAILGAWAWGHRRKR